MRIVLGLLSLLVTLWVVWQLTATQLGAVKKSAVHAPSVDGGATPSVGPRHQPEQVRRTVEGLMQQARPMPPDEQ